MLLFITAHLHAADGTATFTKITSGAIVDVSCTAVAWGDYDNDGWLDLFGTPASSSGPAFLWRNNGNGSFTRIATGAIVGAGGNSFGCAWADFDNDGNLDLFRAVYNFGPGNCQLYRNNGDLSFTQVTSGDIANSGIGANNCVWGDYDNDGLIDMFVAIGFLAPHNLLYHNEGNGTFRKLSNNIVVAHQSVGATWGDYDNDGYLDLFVSHMNPGCYLYHNDRHGGFVLTTNIGLTFPNGGSGCSWADYDNDGFLDLFVAPWNQGQLNSLFHNNGNGTFTRVTNSPIGTDLSSSGGGAWADYDNDGFIDLFAPNLNGSPALFYHNNGDGTFTRVLTGAPSTDPGNGQGAAWADFDNNGFPDLIIPNRTGYSNFLYRNNGNTNGWITVRCEGRMSNRAAIGTKVRARATIRGRLIWQMREVSGGGSLGSQNDLRASFGLGDATNVDLIRIEWPSGIVQQFSDVAAKQFLTVVEPELSISPKEQQPAPGGTATFTFVTTIDPPFTLQWQLDGRDLFDATNSTLVVTNVRAQDGGSYTVRLTTTNGLALHSPAARLSGPVLFAQQPQSQNVRGGSNVTFQATVTGLAPFAYQWQHNGADISGATQSSLTVTNLQFEDSGEYRLAVSNVFGSATSTAATLIVLVRPVITQQPQSQTVVAGDDVTLNVSASGTLPMNFSWRLNNSVFTNMLVNQTNCSLTLRQVRTNQAGNYAVGITNLAGSAARLSSNAVLTVLADTDGDHIPDAWETVHGLDPANALDAALDADADGLTNWQEYLAGTDPNDATSALRITTCYLAPSAASILLRFTATSNKSYRVEFQNDALDWIPLVDLAPTATNRDITVEDATSPDRLRLYRLKLQR